MLNYKIKKLTKKKVEGMSFKYEKDEIEKENKSKK